jgi:hypothetical protein
MRAASCGARAEYLTPRRRPRGGTEGSNPASSTGESMREGATCRWRAVRAGLGVIDAVDRLDIKSVKLQARVGRP